MRLSALISGLDLGRHGEGNPQITHLTADSRQVVPGSLFAALPGSRQDGLAFIPEALARGAQALVVGHVPSEALNVPILHAANPRRALAQIAARFFPRQPQTIVAVTGTSGKTSVASFARQIFGAAGHLSASLGTLGVVVGDRETYGSLTTPDPIELHRLLDQLAQDGVSHAAIEASSHGLDQFRLDGVRLAAGAFTNLSRDHLDYHLSEEAYLKAKLRLVDEVLPSDATMVVEADGAASEAFITATKRRGLKLISVGQRGEGLRLLARERLPQGQNLHLAGCFGEVRLNCPLVGDFQVANVLVAAGLALGVGITSKIVFSSIERLAGVKGRVERIGAVDDAAVYVDYAHKPDALANVLQALRPYTQGRLIIVFGCGGDRDAGKRALMGEIAIKSADLVIVTDDNPRSEEPAKIRAAILAAAPGALEIGSREEAIRASVDMLRAGDVLVIAGKGHETGQVIGKKILPFSDHDIGRAAILARGGTI